MEKQTTWIKSKMTTALGEETVSKLIELVSGLPQQTNVNNVSKLLVYLMETEPDALRQVNQVNLNETAVYLDLFEWFTKQETKYNHLSQETPIDIRETMVYQDLVNWFTEQQVKYSSESRETIADIEVNQGLPSQVNQTQKSITGLPQETVADIEVNQGLPKQVNQKETTMQKSQETIVDIKETKVYLDLENQFTELETKHSISEQKQNIIMQQLVTETQKGKQLTSELEKLKEQVNQAPPKKETTFFWEG
jgi:hypothetical protein